MTVIAVKVYDDKIVMGADSMVSTDVKGYTSNYNDKKIHKINNEFAFGGSGDRSNLSLFNYFARTHSPRESDELSMYEYMMEFQDWAENRGVSRQYLREDGKIYIIIVFKGKIFVCYSDCLWEKTDFATLGSGGSIAYTALHLGCSVERAVQVAIELEHHCGGDIQIIEMERS
jgi:ATP-dependent protease HslVU (ClpYQ) peptidase subunit